MERSDADDHPGFGELSDVSVAVADAPSTSGAHWANRDNDNIYRKTGTPYRRPNAVNSFPGDEEDGGAEPEPASWWGSTPPAADDGDADGESSWPEPPDQAEQPPPHREFVTAPPFGPAPPASSSRASFGVTDGPIGGYRPGYGPAGPVSA